MANGAFRVDAHLTSSQFDISIWVSTFICALSGLARSRWHPSALVMSNEMCHVNIYIRRAIFCKWTIIAHELGRPFNTNKSLYRRAFTKCKQITWRGTLNTYSILLSMRLISFQNKCPTCRRPLGINFGIFFMLTFEVLIAF